MYVNLKCKTEREREGDINTLRAGDADLRF